MSVKTGVNMLKKNLKFYIAGSLLLISFVSLVLSCGQPWGPQTKTPAFNVNGVLVKDLNTGNDLTYFEIQRNAIFSNVDTVKVDTFFIFFFETGKYFSDTLTLTHLSRPKIRIVNGSDPFVSADSIRIPGFFQIDTISGIPYPLNPGGLTVTLTFTTSESTSSYMMSVVPGDTLSTALGYRSFETCCQATIPQEAFRDSAGNPQSGTYYIYMASFKNSFYPYPGIPFSLPAGMPISSLPNTTGTFGAGVIAQKDSVIVP